MDFSACGKLLCSGSADGTLKLWDADLSRAEAATPATAANDQPRSGGGGGWLASYVAGGTARAAAAAAAAAEAGSGEGSGGAQGRGAAAAVKPRAVSTVCFTERNLLLAAAV